MAFNPSTQNQISDKSIMDKYGKQTYQSQQFIYSVKTNTPGATSETPLLLLSNPSVAGSAFTSKYQSLFVNRAKIICLTASETAIMRIYLNPTVSSAGTPETPINLRTGSNGTSFSSSISALSLDPTISANGSLIQTLSSNTLVPDLSDLLSIVDPGAALLVTVQCGSSVTAIASELSWYEL